MHDKEKNVFLVYWKTIHMQFLLHFHGTLNDVIDNSRKVTKDRLIVGLLV